MVRPCFLVIDQEFPGSISTRKLVIETAKLNVITAYSGKEALATLERFPSVSGVVLDAGVKDMAADDLVRDLKKLQPRLPVVVISTPGSSWCREADHHLEFFDPVRLLSLLKKLAPEEAREIVGKEDEMKADAADE